MRKLSELSLILLIILFAFACSEDEDGSTSTADDTTSEPTASNIVEIAQAEGFTSLAAALTRAELVDDLQADGTFTVFAPTDEAFDALLSAIGQESVDDVPVSVLEKILLYHVLSDTVFSSAIKPGMVMTLEGSDITLATDDGVTVNGASVTTADVAASNGVIHIIDAVLVPEDIAQFVDTVLEPAYFNVGFTLLVEAVVKADLVDDLLTADAGGAITIFAPNNDAFAAAGIGSAELAGLDAEVLSNILGFHVLGSTVLAADLPSTAVTLQEDQLFFSITDDGTFINGGTEIIAINIESGNSVIHVINNVLMPASGDLVAVASGLADAGDASEFTSLVAALQRTADEANSPSNLIEALQGTGPFTVFAPTDSAFQVLLDSNQEWTQLSDIDIVTLHSVLTYHVVSGNVLDIDLAGAVDSNNQVTALSEGKLTFDLTNLTINTSANITSTNVRASNGVIHVIDEALLAPAE